MSMRKRWRDGRVGQGRPIDARDGQVLRRKIPFKIAKIGILIYRRFQSGGKEAVWVREPKPIVQMSETVKFQAQYAP